MTNNPLAYHLAEALFSLIYSAGSTLYRRLNLTAFIYNCCSAMLKGVKDAEEDLKRIESKLKTLRESYEPIMDIYPAVFEKKIAFEIYLDKVIEDLLLLINDFELVNPRILQEVYAARWGEK